MERAPVFSKWHKDQVRLPGKRGPAKAGLHLSRDLGCEAAPRGALCWEQTHALELGCLLLGQ